MFSRILSRVGLLAAPFLAVIMAGCSKADLTVRQSTMDPKGPVSQVQFDVFMSTVWLVVVLFVLVGGLLVFAVIKFRSRPGDENKPAIIEEGHGNPLIEIGLITASIGALVIIAIPTLSAIWYTDEVPAESVPTSKLSAWYPRVEGTRENYAKSVEEQVLEVDVIGKQWWFRFEYPQLGMTNDAKHSVPNELVIPKGKAVRINLRSEDVIHSFWVPKIAGKVDLMPGRKNRMWIQADQAGHYYGQCAEFCGDSHAYMLFRVEVVEPAEFAKWVQKQKAEAAPVAAGSKAEKGKALFAAKSCVMCHNVGGHFGAGASVPTSRTSPRASRSPAPGSTTATRTPSGALEQKTGNTEDSVPVDPGHAEGQPHQVDRFLRRRARRGRQADQGREARQPHALLQDVQRRGPPRDEPVLHRRGARLPRRIPPHPQVSPTFSSSDHVPRLPSRPRRLQDGAGP
jgi:cytochrome c oxidase subunit II